LWKLLTSLRIVTNFKLKLISFFSDRHKRVTVTSSKIHWLIYPLMYRTISVKIQRKHISVPSQLYDTRSVVSKLFCLDGQMGLFPKCSRCGKPLREHSVWAYLIVYYLQITHTFLIFCTDKGKLHPIRDHEGKEGSSGITTLSLTSVLDGVVG
jgi:hypothetical protein